MPKNYWLPKREREARARMRERDEIIREAREAAREAAQAFKEYHAPEELKLKRALTTRAPRVYATTVHGYKALAIVWGSK